MSYVEQHLLSICNQKFWEIPVVMTTWNPTTVEIFGDWDLQN